MSTVYRIACLSGGAFRGAIQVGMLEKLYQQLPDLHFDGIVGISTGALTASYLGRARTPNQWPTRAETWDSLQVVKKIYEGLRDRFDIFGHFPTKFGSKAWFARKLLPVGDFERSAIASFLDHQLGIFHEEPLQEKLAKYLVLDAHEQPVNCHWSDRVGVGVVSVTDKSFHYADRSLAGLTPAQAIPWIVASTAIPAFLTPITIPADRNGKKVDELWFDGGVRNRYPYGRGLDLLKTLAQKGVTPSGTADLSKLPTTCSDPQCPLHGATDTLYEDRTVLELFLFNSDPIFAADGTLVDPGDDKPLKHWLDVAMRAIDILYHEMILGDLRDMYQRNQLARMGRKYKATDRYVRVYSLDPQERIPKDSKEFKPEEMKAAIAEGAKAAERFLQKPCARLLDHLGSNISGSKKAERLDVRAIVREVANVEVPN